VVFGQVLIRQVECWPLIQRTDCMITCHVKYVIDSYQLAAFERYSGQWIGLVTRLGGEHHGYFLPLKVPTTLPIACSVSLLSLITNGIAIRLRRMESVCVGWKRRRR
jgi:hypothetical protein